MQLKNISRFENIQCKNTSYKRTLHKEDSKRSVWQKIYYFCFLLTYRIILFWDVPERKHLSQMVKKAISTNGITCAEYFAGLLQQQTVALLRKGTHVNINKRKPKSLWYTFRPTLVSVNQISSPFSMNSKHWNRHYNTRLSSFCFLLNPYPPTVSVI
jgi:hypothetical protein